VDLEVALFSSEMLESNKSKSLFVVGLRKENDCQQFSLDRGVIPFCVV